MTSTLLDVSMMEDEDTTDNFSFRQSLEKKIEEIKSKQQRNFAISQCNFHSDMEDIYKVIQDTIKNGSLASKEDFCLLPMLHDSIKRSSNFGSGNISLDTVWANAFKIEMSSIVKCWPEYLTRTLGEGNSCYRTPTHIFEKLIAKSSPAEDQQEKQLKHEDVASTSCEQKPFCWNTNFATTTDADEKKIERNAKYLIRDSMKKKGVRRINCKQIQKKRKGAASANISLINKDCHYNLWIDPKNHLKLYFWRDNVKS